MHGPLIVGFMVRYAGLGVWSFCHFDGTTLLLAVSSYLLTYLLLAIMYAHSAELMILMFLHKGSVKYKCTNKLCTHYVMKNIAMVTL